MKPHLSDAIPTMWNSLQTATDSGKGWKDLSILTDQCKKELRNDFVQNMNELANEVRIFKSKYNSDAFDQYLA